MNPIEKDLKRLSESPEKSGIIGMDEVGRGCLAGPIFACAVFLNKNLLEIIPKEVTDSKKLSYKKRQKLAQDIIACGVPYKMGQHSAAEIDEIGINPANKSAFKIAQDRVIKEFNLENTINIVDGSMPVENSECIVKGEMESAAIACASILAKVARDTLMESRAKQFPHYKWESNMGYGSKAHILGLLEYGPTQMHRKTFLNLKAWKKKYTC
jgi:ribonuclease HII